MSTIKKLLEIKEAEFETLVALYLRRTNQKLKSLIHTGMNDEGKLIKCPVDAILHVTGPPSELVHLAATVEKPAGIRRKWLGGPKAKGKPEVGDIAKAHEVFESWTEETPSKRTLYLAWNGQLKNKIDLYREIKQRCKDLNIELELIEASLLVDFLDRDPEGQYLREEFLGIDASRLSENLLRKIGIRSLCYHKQKFEGRSVAQSEIERDICSHLESLLTDRSVGLIGVVAPSGAGKSTLIRQSAVKLQSKDVIGLWAPAEDIESAVSPATLLHRVLRRFHPALNERAGNDALDIVERSLSKIALLVDDVNRVASPSEALEAIRICSRFDRAEAENQPRIGFVVPIWPSHLMEQTHEKRNEWTIVQLNFYSQEERNRLAIAHSGSDRAETLLLLDTLKGDPFLCGLALSSFGRMASSLKTKRSVILRTIVEDILTMAILEATKSQDDATQDQYSVALERLVELTILNDNPELDWRIITKSLGEFDSRLLLRLGKTNQIGWVEQSVDGSFWRWKHDRLRDAIVGKWLARQVRLRFSETRDDIDLFRFMSIPGLAEAWGWAFPFIGSEFHSQVVDMLCEKQPLALAAALTLNEFENDGPKARLISGLRSRLEGQAFLADSFVQAPLWSVLYRLTQISSPAVLEITKDLERNWQVYVGRFRNGETHAGLRLMKRFFTFFGINFPLLDRAKDGYLQINGNRRSRVVRELLSELQDPTSLIPVLAFCGYVRWQELAELAWNAWNAVAEDDKQKALVPLIWALSRCGQEKGDNRLEEALLRGRLWSDEDRIEGNTNHASERYRKFIEPLHFVLSTEITKPASETIARVATHHDDLRSNMLYVLRGIDMPATMEAYVRLTARFGGSWWDQIEATESHEISTFRREKVPVRQNSRERLWRLIATAEPHDVRKVALWHWKRFVVADDLERVQSIMAKDPLFDEILTVRLGLRDRTATQLLLDRIESRPGAWLPYCYLLYDEPGVPEALFSNLEAALESHIIERQYVERIPQNLPADGVRRLLNEKAGLLSATPEMWNSLWRSDVSEALEFLGQVMAGAKSEELEEFGMGGGNSYFVSDRMVEVVVPVFHRFSEMTQFWLITLFLNAGKAATLESHGIPRKVRGFKGTLRCWLNEADGRTVLNAAARAVSKGPRSVRRSTNFYDLERQSNNIGFDLRTLLRKWTLESTTPDKTVVAGMLMAQLGTREDLTWWYGLQPDELSPAYEVWRNSLYILRRRSWQKHD
ncbi:MAG TPA: ATP-binding protein [Pyrinomonadaceae bacterium]|nr:ATP-binding protein [Pyrinomonadaceae bacterium]